MIKYATLLFSAVARLEPADALLEPGLAAGLALQQPEPRVAPGAERRRPEAPHPRLLAQPQQAGRRRRRQGCHRAGRARWGRGGRRQEGLCVRHPRADGGRRVRLRPLQTSHVLGSEAAAAAEGAGEPDADSAASEGVQRAEGR